MPLDAPPPEDDVCALAEVVTPSLQGDAAMQARVYSNFLYFFGDLPADSRTKLSLFVRAVGLLCRIRHGAAFADLPVSTRHAVCKRLADAPVGRLQAGFTGLRSLVLMATYTEPAYWDRIDYDGPTVGAEGNAGDEGRGAVGRRG